MSRSLLACCAAALLAAGCVPVTEPIGDITKAEQDKELVGKWTVTKRDGVVVTDEQDAYTFDVPEVKGNPKGLMRVRRQDKDALWFFVSPVGKHTYANIILGERDLPAFDKEDEYAKWQKAEKKQFFVFRYVRDGDTLTIDGGNAKTFEARMKDEGIEPDKGEHLSFFKTPTGWLAKYFDKNGSDKIYDGSNSIVLKREKK
jgi:hypothetical protein